MPNPCGALLHMRVGWGGVFIIFIDIVMMMMRYTIVVLCVLWAGYVGSGSRLYAQEPAPVYAYSLSMDTVLTEGFYQVILPAAVIGYSTPQLSDLRIWNAQGQECPYIYQVAQEEYLGEGFEPYPILSRRTKGGYTTIEFEVVGRQLNHLALEFRNTGLYKRMSLSGSYNQSEWYAISQNLVLPPLSSERSTLNYQSLALPLTDYRYYRLMLRDSLASPIPLVRVGQYTQRMGNSSYYEPLPKPAISQTDSADVSLCRISFAYPVHLDQLRLMVSHPTLYHRQACIVVNPTEYCYEQFELQTGQEPLLYPGLYGQHFYVRIQNGNNIPLQLDSVYAASLQRSLVAYLLPGAHRLVFGNAAVASPSYDLEHFAAQMPRSIPQLQLQPFAPTPQPESSKPSSLFSTTLLWVGMVVVLLLLALVSFKMLREPSKEKE